jgi:HEAT repeat protein
VQSIALPILYDALTKDDTRIRTQAIVVLGKIAHPESVNALAQALDSNYSYEVEAAINALEKIKTRSAIEALQIALTNSKRDSSKVRNIERALGRMHQSEIPLLYENRKAMKDPLKPAH